MFPGQRVTFSSDFDSGNMSRVEMISRNVFQVDAAVDSEYEKCNKTFFHFSVSGFSQESIKFVVRNIGQLKLFEHEHTYRPYIKAAHTDYYQRMGSSARLLES